MKIDRKSSRWLENTVGKAEIARYEQFLLFPQCFPKTSTFDTQKQKPGLVWDRVNNASPKIIDLDQPVLAQNF